MSIATLNDIFFAAVERNLDRMHALPRGGKMAADLSREFGAERRPHRSHCCTPGAFGTGDRIAILSENRPEWPIADMASLLLGAVTVPLYTTLTAEQTAFVLNDAGCRAIFFHPTSNCTRSCRFFRRRRSTRSWSWTRWSLRATLLRLPANA